MFLKCHYLQLKVLIVFVLLSGASAGPKHRRGSKNSSKNICTIGDPNLILPKQTRKLQQDSVDVKVEMTGDCPPVFHIFNCCSQELLGDTQYQLSDRARIFVEYIQQFHGPLENASLSVEKDELGDKIHNLRIGLESITSKFMAAMDANCDTYTEEVDLECTQVNVTDVLQLSGDNYAECTLTLFSDAMSILSSFISKLAQ